MEFRYQAVDARGRITEGRLEARGESEVSRTLLKQGLTALEINPVGAREAGAPKGRRKSASAQDKAIVVRELATLLKAGVPLAEAVESIARTHLDSQIGGAFSKLHSLLRAGEAFSAALAKVELKFPDYLFQLAASGELTGKLNDALESAATQMEYEERVKREIRNAMIYPIILVLSGISATLLIFIVVVPKFASILKSSRSNVPDISKWVLEFGLFVNQHLLGLGIGAVALVFGLASVAGNSRLRAAMLEWVSRLPMVGVWLIEIETGKWATMLATLLENRVSLIKAMELAQKSVRLETIAAKMQRAQQDVRAGKKLADALAASNSISLTGINLVSVGERTGELASMLRTLATLYENSTRERLKRFLILLEPIAILLIGSVIGVIMIAIMLAVTSMSNFAP